MDVVTLIILEGDMFDNKQFHIMKTGLYCHLYICFKQVKSYENCQIFIQEILIKTTIQYLSLRKVFNFIRNCINFNIPEIGNNIICEN